MATFANHLAFTADKVTGHERSLFVTKNGESDIQAMFLRRLLRGSYWCVLVTKTKCEQALLPLPGRDSVPAYGAIPHEVSMVTLKTNASAPELYPNLETESRL